MKGNKLEETGKFISNLGSVIICIVVLVIIIFILVLLF